MQREAFHVRRRRDRPLRLMPSAADNPLAGFGLFDRAPHLRHDFVPGARFAQIEPHAEFADAGEMPVAFDKARNGQHAVQIDHLRVGSDPLRSSAVGAERRNLAGTHGDCLCGGRGRIHGDDLAVAQDEIRGLCLQRHGERSKGDGQQYTHGIQDTDSRQAASIELPLLGCRYCVAVTPWTSARPRPDLSSPPAPAL